MYDSTHFISYYIRRTQYDSGVYTLYSLSCDNIVLWFPLEAAKAPH